MHIAVAVIGQQLNLVLSETGMQMHIRQLLDITSGQINPAAEIHLIYFLSGHQFEHRCKKMIQVDGPPTGPLVRKLTNIKEERIDDSMFGVPEGYIKVNKPAQGFCGAGFCTVSLF